MAVAVRGFLVLSLTLLSTQACNIELTPPDGSLIICSGEQSLCPEGFRCDPDLGFCLPTDSSDAQAPAIRGTPVVHQTVLGSGARLEVTFEADERLLVPPTVRLRIGQFEAELERSTAAGGTYSFDYLVQGSEPEGTATVSAVLTDVHGNRSDDLVVGSVDFDFSPPVVNDITLVGPVLQGGQAWTDDVSLSVTVDVTDNPAGVATVVLGGELEVTGELAFASSMDIELLFGDGPKSFTLQFVDAVGNTTPVSLESVALDTAEPDNTILIDIPVAPSGEVWVNQDALSIYFHSEDELPADFDAYVASVDDGATWQVIGDVGPFQLEPVPQDATTRVLIKERDLFGNFTPDDLKGELVVHEDSQRPTAPELASTTIVTRFSNRADVLVVDRAHDTSPLTYEALGGSYSEFTDVGTGPRISLLGIPDSGEAVFVIRAVDRAGNASQIAPLLMVNDISRGLGRTGCIGQVCMYRGRWTARDGKVIWRGWLYSGGYYSAWLVACSGPPGGILDCQEVVSEGSVVTQDLDYVRVDIFGRYVAYEQEEGDEADTQVSLLDLGPDGYPSSADDAGPFLIQADGRCPALADNGLVYARADNQLHFYAFGNDQEYGTLDAGEGEALVPISANVASSCQICFNGRHLVWTEDSGDRLLFDFGVDRTPGTADDGTRVVLGNGSDPLLLDRDRIYVEGALVDLGRDREYGTGDDTTVSIAYVTSFAGDKVLVGDTSEASSGVLLDVSTGDSMAIENSSFTNKLSVFPVVGEGVVLFALQVPPVAEPVPAVLALHSWPARTWVVTPSSEPAPMGAVSGALAFLSPPTDDSTKRLFNLETGDGWQVSATWARGDWGDGLDIDGSLVVYRGTDEGIWLLDVGADLVGGTADDRAPELVAEGPARWPRIDGAVIVWADLRGDADGAWYGEDLVSTIDAVDLGADGWLGGGDDTHHDVTTTGKEIFPDVSNGRVVWLDMGADTDGLCPGGLDYEGSFYIDDWDCETTVGSRLLGSAPEVLEATVAPRAGIQIEGDGVVWIERYAVDTDYAWEVFHLTIGGSATRVTHADSEPWRIWDKTHPTLDNGRVGYFQGGPVVLDAGSDQVFGTSDDIYLAREIRSGMGGAIASLTPAFLGSVVRPRWSTARSSISAPRRSRSTAA